MLSNYKVLKTKDKIDLGLCGYYIIYLLIDLGFMILYIIGVIYDEITTDIDSV